MHRRSLIRLALATPTFHLGIASAKDAFPSRSITLVVPYPAGGNLDAMTRAVAVPMSKILGQPIVVDNRAGAGGIIGHEYTKRAAPDGYTMVCTANGSFAVTPRLLPKRPFVASDFVAVGGIGETPLVLEVGRNSRFQDYTSFIAYAKANPEKVSIAHAGNGTTNHVAILRLQEATGVKFSIIPYKGSAPALNDLLGGQVDSMIDQLPSSLPHLKAKKLSPLAVTTTSRAFDLPDTPTLRELGVSNFEVSTVTGLLAPAKTPPNIVRTVNAALNTALAQAEVQTLLRNLGSRGIPNTPEAFQNYLAGEDQNAEKMLRAGLLEKQ